MQKILLGQLGANGDCMYATILARQLRADYPDAHIVWGISNQCESIIDNNPSIDEKWVINISDWDQHEPMWKVFEREAIQRYIRREYDQIYLSQIWPNNFRNFDGTVRPSILRSYGKPITVPIENVIKLTEQEKSNVDEYARRHQLDDYENVILFECTSKSGQSFVDIPYSQKVAKYLYKILPDTRVIFSTHLPIKLKDSRSCYAGDLTIREIVYLTHYCSMFVGSGSGCTVAVSSTASKPLPMIQILSKETSVFASFAHDFEYFNIDKYEVLELTEEKPSIASDCIALACKKGIEAARLQYNGVIPVNFDHYFTLIGTMLIKQEKWLDAARSLLVTANRYGWTQELIDFGKAKILPFIHLDLAYTFLGNQNLHEKLHDEISNALSHPVSEPMQKRWLSE
jgi:hypothetical protein